METVTIKLSDSSRDLIEAYRHVPALVVDAIVRGLFKANVLALSLIQRTRFTGQGAFPVAERKLGVDTGRLRRSLRTDAPEIVSVEQLQVKTAMGSPVEYLGPHEFGFRGPVSVAAHTRTRGDSTHPVKAHTRTMDMPERAPLRTGLRSDEVQAIYTSELEKALVEDLTNPGGLT